MIDDADLLQRLNAARRAQGLTLSECARRADLSLTTLRGIFGGNPQSPRSSTLKRLADVLGVPYEGPAHQPVPKPPLELTPLQRNLGEALASSKMSARECAQKAGLSPTAVTDILLGRVVSPRVQTLKRIADVLGLPYEVLNGEEFEFFAAARYVKVTGRIEAGAWRERPYQLQPTATPIPHDPRYIDKPAFALVVADTSCEPHFPINTFLICVNYEDIGHQPQAGDLTVIERHRPDGLVELGVGRVEQKRGGGLSVVSLQVNGSVWGFGQNDDGTSIQPAARVVMTIRLHGISPS